MSEALEVIVARIEERQIAQASASEHRHQNIMLAMKQFATKAEVRVIRDDVAELKSHRNKAILAVVVSWAAIIANYIGLPKV
jgi:hypothetical protein